MSADRTPGQDQGLRADRSEPFRPQLKDMTVQLDELFAKVHSNTAVLIRQDQIFWFNRVVIGADATAPDDQTNYELRQIGPAVDEQQVLNIFAREGFLPQAVRTVIKAGQYSGPDLNDEVIGDFNKAIADKLAKS